MRSKVPTTRRQQPQPPPPIFAPPAVNPRTRAPVLGPQPAGYQWDGVNIDLLSLVPKRLPRKGPQKFIAKNLSPEVFYDNMLDRKLEHGHCSLYVSGFPCKAFSKLCFRSQLLADPRAEPFWAVFHNRCCGSHQASWCQGSENMHDANDGFSRPCSNPAARKRFWF
jgi:hypothetical protein